MVQQQTSYSPYEKSLMLATARYCWREHVSPTSSSAVSVCKRIAGTNDTPAINAATAARLSVSAFLAVQNAR